MENFFTHLYFSNSIIFVIFGLWVKNFFRIKQYVKENVKKNFWNRKTKNDKTMSVQTKNKAIIFYTLVSIYRSFDLACIHKNAYKGV